jgi:hypothetical protein
MGKFASRLTAAFCFWGYILVKVYGTAFAAWSWLWVLFPFIPWLGLALHRLGLM